MRCFLALAVLALFVIAASADTQQTDEDRDQLRYGMATPSLQAIVKQRRN